MPTSRRRAPRMWRKVVAFTHAQRQALHELAAERSDEPGNISAEIRDAVAAHIARQQRKLRAVPREGADSSAALAEAKNHLAAVMNAHRDGYVAYVKARTAGEDREPYRPAYTAYKRAYAAHLALRKAEGE